MPTTISFLDIFDLLEMNEKFDIDIDYRMFNDDARFYLSSSRRFPYFNNGKLCTKFVKEIQEDEQSEVLNDEGHPLSPPLMCAYIKLIFEKACVKGLIIPYGDEKYNVAKCVPWIYDIDLMNALHPNHNFIICRRYRTLVYKGGELEIIPLDVSRLMKYANFQDRGIHIETINEYENYWKTLQQRSRLGIDFMRDRFVVYGLDSIHFHYMNSISIKYGIGIRIDFTDNDSKLENDITFQNLLDKVCRDHMMFRYIIYLKRFERTRAKRNIFNAIPISPPTLNDCEKPIDIKLLKEIYNNVENSVTAFNYELFYKNSLAPDVPMILFPLRAISKEVVKEIDDLVDFVNRH